MELRQLRYFKMLCQEGSYCKAASQLFITQQGLSRSIQQLETELQTTLLDRTVTPFVLTPHGEYLLQRCNIILNEADETTDAFARVHRLAENTLSVAYSSNTMQMLPPYLHARFLQNNPDMALEVSDYPDTVAEQMLHDEQLDVVISALPVDESQFHVMHLMRVPMYALMHNGHPLAHKLEVSVKELCQHEVAVIDPRFKSNDMFKQACLHHGVTPVKIHTATTSLALFQIVQNTNSAGITFSHLSSIFNSPTMSYVRISDPEMDFKICLLTKKGRAKTPAISAYMTNAFEVTQEL